MKAAVLRGTRKLEIEDRDEPEFGDDEVLVAVRACAICCSDLHGFEGLIPRRRPVGLTMGHESSGIVANIGKAVTHLQEGDRVAIDPQISCGDCYPCQQGWFNLCEHVEILGSAMRGYRNGANAEYVCVPGKNAYRMPHNLSFEEAALAEPVGNAIHLNQRTGVGPGSKVVLIGAGAIGSVAIQVAKWLGAARVDVIEPSAFKRDLALQLGADAVINPDSEDVKEQVRELSGGLGGDIILECCGVEATYQLAVDLARKRGVVGAFGFFADTVTFTMQPIIFSEISIIGCTGFYWPEDPALEMMSDGRINVKPLITHDFALDDAQQAYENAGNTNAIKTIIKP